MDNVHSPMLGIVRGTEILKGNIFTQIGLLEFNRNIRHV